MAGAEERDPAKTVRQLEVDLAGIKRSIDESRTLIERSRRLREADMDQGEETAAS